MKPVLSPFGPMRLATGIRRAADASGRAGADYRGMGQKSTAPKSHEAGRMWQGDETGGETGLNQGVHQDERHVVLRTQAADLGVERLGEPREQLLGGEGAVTE